MMNRIFKGLLASAAVAGVSYYLRNRRSGRELASRDRGETIYDNHIPVATE